MAKNQMKFNISCDDALFLFSLLSAKKRRCNPVSALKYSVKSSLFKVEISNAIIKCKIYGVISKNNETHKALPTHSDKDRKPEKERLMHVVTVSICQKQKITENG